DSGAAAICFRCDKAHEGAARWARSADRILGSSLDPRDVYGGRKGHKKLRPDQAFYLQRTRSGAPTSTTTRGCGDRIFEREDQSWMRRRSDLRYMGRNSFSMGSGGIFTALYLIYMRAARN